MIENVIDEVTRMGCQNFDIPSDSYSMRNFLGGVFAFSLSERKSCKKKQTNLQFDRRAPINCAAEGFSVPEGSGCFFCGSEARKQELRNFRQTKWRLRFDGRVKILNFDERREKAMHFYDGNLCESDLAVSQCFGLEGLR